MKLFITDYDGTLYTSDEKMIENIKKLKQLQKKNFKIIISTGRSFPSIKEQINYFNIPYDYLCCADGSIIYDNQNLIIHYLAMDNQIIQPLEDFYQKLDYEEIQFSYPDGYHNTLNNDILLGINVCINSKLYNPKLVNQFLKLKDNFPNYNYLCYMHPNFSYLCIKPENVSKSYAISYLQKKLNIQDNDIYVIGDSSNDLEMLQDFHGVAMKNSYPDVLKIAKKTYQEVSDYINDILKEEQ